MRFLYALLAGVLSLLLALVVVAALKFAPGKALAIAHGGPWEEELDEQLRAAEDVALARERDRMGLT